MKRLCDNVKNVTLSHVVELLMRTVGGSIAVKILSLAPGTMQPLQPEGQNIDILVPRKLLAEIIAVWHLLPLRLSPAECRSFSTMMLAAQSLRRSSRDWLRVLAQEFLYDAKHSENKVALMTIPYIGLPATVLGDIYKFIVIDELAILQHIHEVAVDLSVPRSIAVVEGNSVTFRYRQTRDAVIERLRSESLLHNLIRTWISRLVEANLLSSSQIHVLKRRAFGLMNIIVTI